MKPTALASLSDDELVERFRLFAHQVGDAVINWMPAARKTDRLFEIKAALRKRGKTSRLKLENMLKDRDRFVQYYAAKELYGLLPQHCRPIIEVNTREFDAIAGDARGFLRAIDEGTYQPE